MTAATQASYLELKRKIEAHGFLNRQPGYYAWVTARTLAFLAVSITCLALVDNLWIQLGNAAFLAFAHTQTGFLAHDAGHRQIFSARSARRNDLVMLAAGFVMGLVPSWWRDKHGRHHANPNNVDEDLDINLSIVAFTKEQALAKRGLFRFIVQRQAYLFFPMLLLEGWSIRADSAQFLWKGKPRPPWPEWAVFLAHPAAYFGLLALLLEPLHILFFLVVHQALLGVHLGLVFATNHKGMPMTDNARQDQNFVLRQVKTSRNVKDWHGILSFFMGGLNYQIEHHLFPFMPRNNLAKARPLVKEFCRQQGIAYCETGLLASLRDILAFLHGVSGALR